MTGIKIFFVFMYLKMQELSGALWRFIKYIWKGCIKGIIISVEFICSFTVVGLCVLGICSFFAKELVVSWIVYCVAQQDNFIRGVIAASFVVGLLGFLVIAIGWCIQNGIRNNWYKLPKFLNANWQKATHIVVGKSK